jgi:hypothetical protein
VSHARVALAITAVVACRGKPAGHDDAKPAPRTLDAVAPVEVPADAAPPARVEHAVWKPVPNRHGAHRAIDGELVIDARDIGFARYLHFGLPAPRWHLGQTVDGERAAIADRLASIELPLGTDQVGATQLTARIHGAAKQAVAVKLNGRKAGRFVLDAGWQTIAFHLDHKLLVAGENQLVLETTGKQRIALAWLRVGSEHPVGTDDPLAAATFDAKADALELASNAQLAWFVTVPDSSSFVVDGVGAGCHVALVARAGDATLVGGLLGDTLRVNLSSLAGKVVRLALSARDCPRARVVHPRITLPGPEPQPLLDSDPPRTVILWVMDGLPANVQAPALDELARYSTVFRRFYMQGPMVARELPGHVTIAVRGTGASLVDAALAQLDKHRAEPAYLFLGPARAPPSCPPGAVAEQDAQLGRLVAQLQSWGIWDETLLIVTSDHGTDCGQDASLRDAALHVPLVIHDPARFPEATIVDEGTDSVDLWPSIFAALGKPLPDDAQGEPLERLAQGIGRGWARPSLASAGHAHAMRIGRWKIRVSGSGEATIGDVEADPTETRDVGAERPVELRMLTDHLAMFLALESNWKKSEMGVVTNVTPEGAAALDDASTP